MNNSVFQVYVLFLGFFTGLFLYCLEIIKRNKEIEWQNIYSHVEVKEAVKYMGNQTKATQVSHSLNWCYIRIGIGKSFSSREFTLFLMWTAEISCVSLDIPI